MLLLMMLLWVLPAGNALSSHNSKLRREVWELKQTVQEFSKEREKHKEYEKLPICCLSRAPFQALWTLTNVDVFFVRARTTVTAS